MDNSDLIRWDIEEIQKEVIPPLKMLKNVPNELYMVRRECLSILDQSFSKIVDIIEKALGKSGEYYCRLYIKKSGRGEYRRIALPTYTAMSRKEWMKISAFYMNYYRSLVPLNDFDLGSAMYELLNANEFPKLFLKLRADVNFAVKTDITKLSVSISHKLALDILSKTSLSANAKKFAEWYINGQFIYFNNIAIKARKGIVQGGHITEQLLFLIIKAILYLVAKNAPGIFIFAQKDDILILSEEKDRAKIAYRTLESVVKDFGLELNKSKTEFVDLGYKGIDYLAYRIDERKNLTVSHRSWGKFKKELGGGNFKKTIKLCCP